MKINNYLQTNNQIRNYSNSDTKAKKFESQLNYAIKTKDDENLMKQCKEFESIFTNMLFKQMRSTIPQNDLIEKSMGRDIFEGMFDEEIAKDASDNNSIGLAKMLYNQLSKKSINQE